MPLLPILFAFFAGLSRLLLPDTESRDHIATFVTCAAFVELIAKPMAGRPPSGRSLLVNAGAVVLSVVGVKWWLEGISPAHWLRVAGVLLGRL